MDGLGAEFQGKTGDGRRRQRLVERDRYIAGDSGRAGASVLGRGRFLTEPVLYTAESGMMGGVIVDDLALAIGTKPAVEIDQADVMRLPGLASQDLAQGAVRPGRRSAAI